MADSLGNILMNRSFDEPEEATSIKNFVLEKWGKSVAVTVREKDILIVAQGASFANALRLQSRQMQRAAGTTKRLVIRIA